MKVPSKYQTKLDHSQIKNENKIIININHRSKIIVISRIRNYIFVNGFYNQLDLVSSNNQSLSILMLNLKLFGEIINSKRIK